MSRARFLARRPLVWLLALVVPGCLAVDVATGRWSATGIALLLLVAGSLLEFLYRYEREVQQREAEANARWSLTGLMAGGEPWPFLGGWALGPAAVAEWIRRVSLIPSPQVVELGPGSSTLMLARAVPHASIKAVEHDPAYADRLRLLARDLESITVVEAPLDRGGTREPWYAAEVIDALPRHVDVLLVDGPPNWDGKGKRAPARRVIEERMTAGGLVLADDTNRPDERSMVRSWVDDGLCRIVLDAGSYVFLEKN